MKLWLNVQCFHLVTLNGEEGLILAAAASYERLSQSKTVFFFLFYLQFSLSSSSSSSSCAVTQFKIVQSQVTSAQSVAEALPSVRQPLARTFFGLTHPFRRVGLLATNDRLNGVSLS